MIADFFRRRKILKSTNSLELIPIKILDHEITQQGRIKLLVPRFKNKILSNIFTGNRKSEYFKISLDEKGSKSWLLIDNVKCISDIAKELLTDGQSIDDLENSLITFFVKLYNEGFITFKQLLPPKD